MQPSKDPNESDEAWEARMRALEKTRDLKREDLRRLAEEIQRLREERARLVASAKEGAERRRGGF